MPGARLCQLERDEIQQGLARNDSYGEIGRTLERDPSTICREVKRNGGRDRYRASAAQRRADNEARRWRPTLLGANPGLAGKVRDRLEQRLSPQTISHQVAAEGHQISHETIYTECYRVDSALGNDAWRLLVRRRPSRQRRRSLKRRDTRPLGPIVSVHDRPGDVTTEPGHWEGDLLIGTRNLTACVVLVERISRCCLLGALPAGQGADHVHDVIRSLFATVPPQLRRTLTWDQGRELARWPQLTKDLNLPVYFCDPGSPWQKPLVENTCGHLRRWLPRNQPISTNQRDLDHIAATINSIHRPTLNWHTAIHAYNQLRVATTS